MIAVLYYQHVANPYNLPAEWPREVRHVDELPGPKWVLMSEEDYNSHIAALKPAYDAAWAASEGLRNREKYAENRVREYPEVGEQLDTFYKVLKHLKNLSIDIGLDGDSYIRNIDAIKAKFPKPE